MKPLKVVMLVHKFPPEYSGNTKQVIRLAKAISANYNVKIYFLAPGYGKFQKHENFEGVEVVRFRVFKIKVLGNLLFSISAFLCFARRFRKADILHFQCIVKPLVLTAFFIRHLFKVPVIGTMTLVGADDIDTFAKANGNRFISILRHMHLVSYSNKLSEIYYRYYPDSTRLKLIPNGVDFNKFYPVSTSMKHRLREELGLPLASFIIIFVGIMQERKRPDLAIQAYIQLCEKYDNCLLLMVGPFENNNSKTLDVSKNYVNTLFNFSKELMTEDKIRFLGEVVDSNKYLQAADVYLFTSNNEGLPNVLLEYTATGLPGVSSLLDGITDMIVEDGTTGFLIKHDDPFEYTKKLEELYLDEECRLIMGQKAHVKCKNFYSLDYVASETAKLYYETTVGEIY